MKVSVLQENLARGLSIVGKAVENRPTLPVLHNILLETEDARLKIAATNLQLSVTCWIGAQVDDPGSITLPARTLTELVNSLSPERVDLSLDTATHTVQVHCGMSRSNIKGIDADEFPPILHGDSADITIAGRILREMIQQTAFAAAKEDNRPILTGVYTEFSDNIMTMAAADGYRLAVRTTELEGDVGTSISMVIPARTLMEVGRLIDDDEDVQISFPAQRDLVTFHLRNIDITSQLLEGNFPDFANIIPKQYVTSTTLYTDDLLRACQRAEIFARDNAFSGMFNVVPTTNPSEPSHVTVIGRSAERGDNEGSLDAVAEGEALDISFNIRYLIEVLKVINEERVIFQSNGRDTPGVIRPEDRDDFVHVIMPMSR